MDRHVTMCVIGCQCHIGDNETESKPASIFDKSHICKHSLADVTAEAVGMPAIVHGLNDTADDELT